jgi:hypothetical protein
MDLQKSEGADILFLSEIRMNKRRMEKFRWMLVLTNMLVREGKGKGGGFAVFWRKGVDVSLRSISDYFMDVDVKEEDGFCWRFTGVYGEAHSELKYRTWQQLCGLHVQPVKPWLCAGDFNEILLSHEKEGGRPRSQRCIDLFRDALQHCELHDLGFEGDMFTWRNHNHVADDYIKEWLDRAMANDLWRRRFPGVRVINGDPRHSDHRPVIIDTEKQPRKRSRVDGKLFALRYHG